MNADFAAAYNRSPDWKWKRASSIVEGTGIPATPYWDTDNGYNWIQRAVAFIESSRREPNPVLNEELFILHGDIFTAHSIYTETEGYYRQELEAMILARVEREDLARRIDVPIAVITAYEELFFDVRSKLDTAESYILHYVIGPEVQNLKSNSYGALWKLFGYYEGPEILRAVISKTVNPQFCMTPDAVGARLNEDITGSFKIACAIAAKKEGCGNMGDKQLIQMFTKIMEVDKMEDLSSGSSKGQMAEHIAAILTTLGLTAGGTRVYKAAVQPDKTAEPQFKELVDIALTGSSKDFESAQDFKFPPPKRKTK